MKVKLKIFLPLLPEVIGRKELEVEFAGETVNDLIEHLVAQYGRNAARLVRGVSACGRTQGARSPATV